MKDFRNIFMAILSICLFALTLIGCKENGTENQDYFIKTFKVKVGQTFTFAKKEGIEFWFRYRERNKTYFIFEWPNGTMANGGDIKETYIYIRNKLFFIRFIQLNKKFATVHLRLCND